VRLGLQVLTAGALAVSAYLHVDLAQGYRLIGEQVTMGDLFLAQAAVAVLAALALLVRPTPLTWTFAALIGFGSLTALVLTVYVAVPAIGPFPPLLRVSMVLPEDRVSRSRRTRRHRRATDRPHRPTRATSDGPPPNLTGKRTDTDHRRPSTVADTACSVRM
jgi:hypothetical protein